MAKLGSRLAFQLAPHFRNAVFGRNEHHHMDLILIKANRLNCYTGQTSQQLGEQLLEGATDPRIQDPAAVLAHPHHVILQPGDTVCRLDNFPPLIVPPPGSFTHG